MYWSHSCVSSIQSHRVGGNVYHNLVGHVIPLSATLNRLIMRQPTFVSLISSVYVYIKDGNGVNESSA